VLGGLSATRKQSPTHDIERWLRCEPNQFQSISSNLKGGTKQFGVGSGGVQNFFEMGYRGFFSLCELGHGEFLSENLFVAHTRLNRLRRSDSTRSVEAMVSAILW
jgi:hypothetical protein